MSCGTSAWTIPSLRGKRPSIEILDEHRPASDLDGGQPFAEPDADVSRGERGGRQSDDEKEG